MDYWKKKWKNLIFFALLAGSVFLRVYHFNDWLLAKGDQVRDAMVVERAVEKGTGDLPLLGPRAGGTKLRLGPAFYYLQYASAIIVGNTELPTVAYPNLLFSVAAITVFYLLAKKFFSQDASRIMTVLFSYSFLAIEYSRFTWNPNSVPFFAMLFLYALLRMFDPEEKRRVRWYVLAGVAFAVASQLHFTSFIGLPMLVFFFGLFGFKALRRTISLKGVLLFLAAVLVFYLPVILNDFFSGGENLAQFFKAFAAKSSDNSFWQSAADSAYLFGKYFFRVLTGYLGEMQMLHYAGSLILAVGLYCNWRLFKSEPAGVRKNFLALTLSAFLAFFILYLPIGSGIDKPRFFLPVIYLPFFYLGYLYIYFQAIWPKKLIFQGAIAVALLSLSANLFFSVTWLAELARAYVGPQKPQETIVLKMKKDAAWWTWNHFEKLAAEAAGCGAPDIYLSFAQKVREFEDTGQYALQQRGLTAHVAKNPPTADKACAYYILRSGEDLPEEVKAVYAISYAVNYGSMSIQRIQLKNPAAGSTAAGSTAAGNDDPILPEDEAENAASKFYWKDVASLF